MAWISVGGDMFIDSETGKYSGNADIPGYDPAMFEPENAKANALAAYNYVRSPEYLNGRATAQAQSAAHGGGGLGGVLGIAGMIALAYFTGGASLATEAAAGAGIAGLTAAEAAAVATEYAAYAGSAQAAAAGAGAFAGGAGAAGLGGAALEGASAWPTSAEAGSWAGAGGTGGTGTLTSQVPGWSGAGSPTFGGTVNVAGGATGTGAVGATGANGMDIADWLAQDSAGGGWMPESTGGGAFTTGNYNPNDPFGFLNDNSTSWGTNVGSGGGVENFLPGGQYSPYGGPDGLVDLGGAGGVSGGGLPDPTMVQQLKTMLNNLPTGSQTAAKTALQKLMSGDSMGMSDLVKLGIPAALLAGVFEKNTNPLTANVTQASNSALTSAGAFGALPAVGMQPSWQKAIDTANANTGAWKPYVDKAEAYTNQAAGGIPSVDLSKYINPYIANVLDPALREINLASDAERLRLNHLAAVSGNDTITPGSTSPSGYGVQLDLLNKNKLQRIGDTTAGAYKGAFDTAVTNASADLNRAGSAGGAFNTLANTVGTQGRGDVTTLAGAGDLDAKPAQNALDKAADTTKLYTSIIPGTSSAITATNKPSVLGQAVGAFGAYNAASKMGIL